MTAKAGLLRCCCPPTVGTCTQATNYCPEYVSVNVPEFGYNIVTRTTTHVQDCQWLVATSAGCYYVSPDQTHWYGHAPLNTVIRELTVTMRATNLLFRRVTVHPTAGTCQNLCVQCARYCLVANPTQQTGVFSATHTESAAALFFEQQSGGAMPLVWYSNTASMNRQVKDIQTPADRTGTLTVTQTGTPGAYQCRYDLTIWLAQDWAGTRSGATSNGCACTCCGPPPFGGGSQCMNCLASQEFTAAFRFYLTQQYLVGPPSAAACPSRPAPQVLSAQVRPGFGGRYIDLLDNVNSTINRNGCIDPTQNHSEHYLCQPCPYGGVNQCSVTTSFGNGPCLVTPAQP